MIRVSGNRREPVPPARMTPFTTALGPQASLTWPVLVEGEHATGHPPGMHFVDDLAEAVQGPGQGHQFVSMSFPDL